MKIQPFQTQSTVEPRSVGGRLDIRSDTPALSHVTRAPAHAAGIEGASLAQVLNPQEQEALAAAFTRTEAPAYSGQGTSIDKPPVLGLQLDLQA
jgi:hypothetical protein